MSAVLNQGGAARNGDLDVRGNPLHSLRYMSSSSHPRVNKIPFLAGDALLLGAAFIIYYQARKPMSEVELALAVFCIALGAALAAIPFLLDFRASTRIAEAGALTTVMSQLTQLEAVASQIATASSKWELVQDQADKTAQAAKDIQDRMGIEIKGFEEFMRQINDSEKSTLRLEADKLRRAENDWLQVLVRILDHTYALHLGAVRSGQANVIEQVGHFQAACRDAARRIGLMPLIPTAGEPFDPQRHQRMNGTGDPPQGAAVGDVIATGFTFQGKLVRPALVRLAGASSSGDKPVSPPPGGKEPGP